MRIKISIVFCTIIAITMVNSTNSLAFDGNRKGFVAGLALGVAPVVHWSRSFGDINETDQGRVLNFAFGHGFNSQNVVVFHFTGATILGRNKPSNNELHALIGVQWYHFLSENSRSFYGSIGVGQMAFSSDRSNAGTRGAGFKSEIGYELHRHFQIGAYGIVGWTNSDLSSASHQQFGFLLRLIAY